MSGEEAGEWLEEALAEGRFLLRRCSTRQLYHSNGACLLLAWQTEASQLPEEMLGTDLIIRGGPSPPHPQHDATLLSTPGSGPLLAPTQASLCFKQTREGNRIAGSF